MSRGTVDDLASPYPIFDRLPAILRGEGLPAGPNGSGAPADAELGYHRDGNVADGRSGLPASAWRPTDELAGRFDRGELFTRRFLAGLDALLAPAFVTLDCLDAYLDPQLTPPDFLPWLSGWVGIRPDERWTDQQLRSLMAVAISLYRRRGTGPGLRALVRAYAGVDPDVEDSGGSSVAPPRTPGEASASDPFPGSAEAWVRVRVRVPVDSLVDEARLQELVAQSVPASVRVTIEVARSG